MMNGMNFNGMTMSRLKQMAGMMNPHTLLSQMANTNPDFASILQASRGDYQKAFYDLAKKKGIDPEKFLDEKVKPFM